MSSPGILERTLSRILHPPLYSSHHLLCNIKRIQEERLTDPLLRTVVLVEKVSRVQKPFRIGRSPIVFGKNAVQVLRNVKPLLFNVAQVPVFAEQGLSLFGRELFKTAQSARVRTRGLNLPRSPYFRTGIGHIGLASISQILLMFLYPMSFASDFFSLSFP
uniref:Uncharacterized protein n=1 Tax=Cacopsylla melanoneura TaxID=428564 RepID=A0A8D8S7T6_9HEMI